MPLIIANFFATRWYTFFISFFYIFIMFVVTHKMPSRWYFRIYSITEQFVFMLYFIISSGTILSIQRSVAASAIYQLSLVVKLSWFLAAIPVLLIIIYRIIEHEYFDIMSPLKKSLVLVAVLAVSGVILYLGLLVYSLLYFTV